MTASKIEKGVVVHLQYTLTLDDGRVVDQSTDDQPLVYLHGYGNIIPGLEAELEGLGVDAKKKVSVEAVDAYGERNDDAVQLVERKYLPDDLDPEVGMNLQVQDDHGHVFPAEITKVTDENITLDLNHPLAGKRLHFDVTVTEIREANSDEIIHGHVHGEHGHH